MVIPPVVNRTQEGSIPSHLTNLGRAQGAGWTPNPTSVGSSPTLPATNLWQKQKDPAGITADSHARWVRRRAQRCNSTDRNDSSPQPIGCGR